MIRLRELRKAKNINQQALADLVGVTQAALSGWEREKFEIDQKSLAKLADFFGVSIDYILGREDEKKEPESMNASELDNEIFKVLQDLPEDKKGDVLNYLEFLRAKSQGN